MLQMRAIFKSKYKIIIPLVGLFFVLAYSFLLWHNPQPVFSWPDEMANYFFVGHFKDALNFRAAEPLNALVGDLIHPRSINVFQHDLVPTGFLGLPLIFGLIAKIFGLKATLFLTPMLAVIGAWFFYKLISEIFGEKVGRLSGILLLFQPAYYYYANFVMLPNVAFCSLLIISLYFFVKSSSSKHVAAPLLAGLFFASALIIRPNEFFWLGILLIFFLISLLRQKKYKTAIFSAIPIILVVAGYLLLNRQTYGSFFNTGYQDLTGAPAMSGILKYIFPFGFQIGQIAKIAVKYLFLFHWWQWTLALLGFIVAFIYKPTKKIVVYAILGAIISTYLLIYYGSWSFADQFTVNIANLGLSYHRYWLPILIFVIPFISLSLLTILELDLKFKKLVFAILLALVIGFDLQAVYLSGNDNLIRIRHSIQDNIKVQQFVLEKTPQNSVIISERGDKIIFPLRKVVGQFDLAKLAPLKNLPKDVPLYFLAIDSQFDLESSKKILTDQGLALGDPQPLVNGFTLYEIK